MRWNVMLFILALAACSPCRKLADKICDCYVNQSEKITCKRNLDLQAQHKAFKQAEDRARCVEVLKDPDCTCQAILSGQLEKCGFTRK